MRVPPGSSFVSRAVLRAVLGCSALSGCGPLHTTGSGSGAASAEERGGSARVERREVDHHPPISLVVRLGDPMPAMAFASAHDQGSVASVALSALLLARMRAHGVDEVVSIPGEGGIELAVLCDSAAAAQAFVTQLTNALATPIEARDEALSTVEEHLAALRSHSFAGSAEAAVAECSGELGQLEGKPQLNVRTAAGLAELENYRRFAFAARSSAFAALGSRQFVDAAAAELERVTAWPTGEEPEDPWPTSDRVGTDGADGFRHLSVAVRTGDVEAALSKVRELTSPRAPLAARLQTFLPGYALNRVLFQARPRGACLRVELKLPEGDPGPTPKEAAQAVALVTEEMRAAAPALQTQALDENIVEPSDPRHAAARAAWRALIGRQDPGAPRRFVALSVHPAERAAFAGLASVLNEYETQPPRAPIESRLRAEPGQGELWVLLGTPCGTLGESNDEAGQSALALTLAAHESSAEVTLEPWLTPDAIGLLAHAARGPGESASEQAERVARALARALSVQNPSGDALTRAQSELFSAIGGAPRPGYARLLDALAPDHRAWIEPRGTWNSLSETNRDAVTTRARDLLGGPLRVAVLANQDEAQAQSAARAIERWFAPWRDDTRRCQATAERRALSGEISITSTDASNAESSYVGLPLPSRLRFGHEADLLAITLNAAQGPLSRAFSEAHLDASARASVIGGGRRAALVVDVRASEEDARKAVTEVRRALERLITTELPNDELASAQRAASQRALAASLDPRRRIVDLWRGEPPDAPLSRSSLRAFQAALNGVPEVVLYVTHRD